jgi:hypothetical protein
VLTGLWLSLHEGLGGSLTVQTNIIGPTPGVIGYNFGHFYPGSNTRDWWRYAGVNGVRIFISPGSILPAASPQPPANAVTNQTSFITQKTALRANPAGTNYFNWPYLTNEYANTDLYPVNHVKVNYALGQVTSLGGHVCAQITVSDGSFPIAGTNDWGGQWALWQYFYAQAFYLGSAFAVDHYQMYNEPNNAGITQADFLLRLQIVADALQAALTDVNSFYGTSLNPHLLAPVSAGNATSAFVEWGDLVVTNRHLSFFGVTSTNFWLFQDYDYHQYGASGAGFGSDLASLNALLISYMSPEPPFPVSISEFNTRTASSYDAITTTIDSPADYSRLGSIAVNLMANGISEMYAFKFSQVSYSGNYPVEKNAMYYVENTNSPYNVGGITKAGEVYRLFAKAFAAGRNLLATIESDDATNLDVQCCFDPTTQCYHVYSANSTANPVVLSVNVAALNLPATNQVLLEEVSEDAYGGGVLWTNVGAIQSNLGTQPAYSAWLLTIPSATGQAEQDILPTDDAQVNDGTNKSTNFGGAPVMLVRNNPTNTAYRSAAFIKFQLPTNNPTSLQFALLSLRASTASLNTNVQAHVYALTNTAWSQGTITWSNAPNLKSGIPAGPVITNSVIQGQGTNLFIVGQLVVTSNSTSEKLIDVTSYLRSQTNSVVSFLVSQDPRWDVTLPSLAVGDTQPDGISITSAVGGTGPRLRLVYGAAEMVNPPAPVWTNLVGTVEADIWGGTNATTNVNLVAQGYVMVKYYPSPFGSARKAYFQFALPKVSLQTNTNAVFTVTTSTQTFAYDAQLWALNQDYPGFDTNVTWNTAEANDTNSDNLLTNGAYTATAIGGPLFFPGADSTAYSFTVPVIGNYSFNNRVTLVLTGVDNTNDNSGGLRLALGSATLQVLTAPAPMAATNSFTGITANGPGRFTISFQGASSQAYRILATTNLTSTNWLCVSTNTAGTNGAWTFTDYFATNYPARFYRSVTP